MYLTNKPVLPVSITFTVSETAIPEALAASLRHYARLYTHIDKLYWYEAMQATPTLKLTSATTSVSEEPSDNTTMWVPLPLPT